MQQLYFASVENDNEDEDEEEPQVYYNEESMDEIDYLVSKTKPLVVLIGKLTP